MSAAVLATTSRLAFGDEPVPVFGAISVDVRPLVARGGGGAAALIARIMPAKLQSVFADHVAPGQKGAPTLIARIDTLTMTAFSDRPGPDSNFSGQMDQMEGAGLVVSGRTTVSVTPLRVALQPGYSGAFYLPDIEERRIDSICYQFAYWLRREMNV